MSEATAVEKADAGQLPAQVPEGANDAGSLMRLAIEEKVPVEVLERLMDLHERVDRRNARAAFFEALAAVQEEMPDVRKAKTAKIKTRGGGSYSYTFAPLEQITRTIRPVLRQHGLSYSWTTEDGGQGVLNVVAILRHVDGHEERATFPVPTGTDAAMSDAQKNGAALTYGKRQSLTSVLGLTTADDDVDGQATGAGDKGEQKVNAGQVADLEALVQETGSHRGKFLQWLDVTSLDDLTMTQYHNAVKELERKRNRGQA